MRRLHFRSLSIQQSWGLLLALVFAVAALPGGLRAQGEDPSPHSDAWIVPEGTSIQPGTPFTVAIRFEMEPGWHNYWRNAGDSGLPTTLDWDLPPGFTAGEIQWPFPERIVVYPLVDYGYSGEVALLVDLSPPTDLSPGASADVRVRVNWLICERICLPAHAELEVQIPVEGRSPEADPRWAGLFAETRNRLPRTLPEWSLAAEVTEGGYRLTVEAQGEGTPVPEEVYFYAGEKNVLAHAEPQTLTSRESGFSLDLAGSPYALRPSTALRGVLMAEGGGSWDPAGEVVAMAVEVPVAGAPLPSPEVGDVGGAQGTPGEPTEAPGEGGGDFTLALALAFAFFGGILLNLMPCVFPVLSLKILGSAGQGGEDRATIRNQGLVFGLGVVLSFLAL
ncbi:MAG: protein-disulfide reductase DsbD domain-containing protein, partial [Longimicrobiales bacterium]